MTSELIKSVVYTIGHDQITQTTFTTGGAAEGETLVFHADGHGSVRILTDLAAAIATLGGVRQIFHFDAYGSAIGFNPAQAATSYLYSGEQFDTRIGQQYLRARYYDPAMGRFNRLDDFTGNIRDPQSLHKYLYTHGDPVNGGDPTGESLVSMVVSFGTGLFNVVNTGVLAYGAFKIGFGIGTIVEGLFISQSMTLWEAGGVLRDIAWETFWLALGLIGINQATLRGTSWLVRLRTSGLLAKLASNSGNARAIRGAAAFVQGRLAELYIAQKYTMWRNTARIGAGIPDFIGQTVIREVKNVKRLVWEPQIATFANRALRDGKELVIHIRPGTNISPTLLTNLIAMETRGLVYRIIRDIPEALRVL